MVNLGIGNLVRTPNCVIQFSSIYNYGFESLIQSVTIYNYGFESLIRTAS